MEASVDSVMKCLKDKFGHDHFKSELQRDAVMTVLKGDFFLCDVRHFVFYCYFMVALSVVVMICFCFRWRGCLCVDADWIGKVSLLPASRRFP